MASCNENRFVFLSANATISFPSASAGGTGGVGDHHVDRQTLGMPSERRSGRTPPMLLISGNAAVMLRAARIVLTCRPRSGAISATSSRGASLATTRHLDPRDAAAVSDGPEFTLDWVHDAVLGAAVVTCNATRSADHQQPRRRYWPGLSWMGASAEGKEDGDRGGHYSHCDR